MTAILTPTQLSPTAQTVLDSFLDTDNVIDDRRYLYTETKALADALRAAADQVVPEEQEPVPNEDSVLEMQVWARVSQRQSTRSQLHAIAAELERHYDSLYS